MLYNRNIGAKKYSSMEEIFDSVNNDPKRPGFQIVYIEKRRGMGNSMVEWYKHLMANGYQLEDISEKSPTLGGELYTCLIIKATPEEATALKICF